MGVFHRRDSPFLWLWLETAPAGQQREKTTILKGTTPADRHDNKKLAMVLYHERMRELAANIHRLPIEREAARFRVYAKAYATDTIARRRGAQRELDGLKPLVQFFGHDLLTAIDQERVRQYHTWRLAPKPGRPNGVGASTINREVVILKTMMRDAVPKYLPEDPLSGMAKLKETTPKRRLLKGDEEERLLKVATDPQDYALLVLGIDTLIRQGDLLDITRDDVEGLWLYVAYPKSGTPYEVALSPRAVAALNAIPHTKPHYFEKFRQAVNPRDWRGAVRQRLERLCKAAKIPFGKKAGGITFHWATRRTGATKLLVKNRESVSVVQRIGNWKQPAVLLEIYAEADRDDLLKAVGQPAGAGVIRKREGAKGVDKRRKASA